jgi:hypothetical protein
VSFRWAVFDLLDIVNGPGKIKLKISNIAAFFTIGTRSAFALKRTCGLSGRIHCFNQLPVHNGTDDDGQIERKQRQRGTPSDVKENK